MFTISSRVSDPINERQFLAKTATRYRDATSNPINAITIKRR